MNLNLFAGLYRIRSFLEQIEPQQAGLDLFNLKKTKTIPLVLISFWPQLKAHLIKDQVMNITKETEVVNLRQKGGKIISLKIITFFLLYITYKNHFTIPFFVFAKFMKKNVLEKTIYHCLRIFLLYTVRAPL